MDLIELFDVDNRRRSFHPCQIGSHNVNLKAINIDEENIFLLGFIWIALYLHIPSSCTQFYEIIIHFQYCVRTAVFTSRQWTTELQIY